MTTKNRILVRGVLLAASSLWSVSPALAQTSLPGGSDGSYGPINITSNTTLTLPDDGVFNATTITVQPGVTLRFQRNAKNTPVYLSATGLIDIQGTIDVSGQPGTTSDGGVSGPGGFDGGKPGTLGDAPGDGYGPGAGKGASPTGGAAAYRTLPIGIASSPESGAIYGNNLLLPLAGGSGGGGSDNLGGGGAGGAILLASNEKVQISGKINAAGADDAPRNLGSGGSIRIVSPWVTGTGNLILRGGAMTGGGGRAGDGRVRIDALDRSGLAFNIPPEGGLVIASIGSAMIARLTPEPGLDITEVAGQTIPLGSAPVSVQVSLDCCPDPEGCCPTNCVVGVRVHDFQAQVPVQILFTPDSGQRFVLSATVDNVAANPVTQTFTVDLSAVQNQRVTVQAFAGKDLPPAP